MAIGVVHGPSIRVILDPNAQQERLHATAQLLGPNEVQQFTSSGAEERLCVMGIALTDEETAVSKE